MANDPIVPRAASASGPAGARPLFDPIIVETGLPAPVGRVWRAWTEPDQLAAWFTKRAQVRAEEGGPYELFWEPEHPERNRTQGRRVTARQPHDLLAFTWKGPAIFADLMNTELLPNAVVVTFRATSPSATSVRVEHFGWGSGPRWAEARAWHERCWQEGCANLSQDLALRPHQEPAS